MKKKFLSLSVAALAAATLGGNAQAVPVSLELALLVDVSGSVNATEYNLQKTGYINAFNNAGLQNAIASLPGGIAVTYIEWSSAASQAQLVGWTHVSDATTSDAFATAVDATSRAFGGATAPGSAINFANPLFTNNGFEGARWIIDISGDGQQNSGANTAGARDAFLGQTPVGEGSSIAINGLPIGGGLTLQNWYQNNIVGGPNSFLIAANDFTDFENAVLRKLEREIGGGQVPVPAPLALIGLGLVGLITMRCRSLVAA